ncbi:hypothetical protein [Peptoniphilus porci]|uniref:Uncharacterized protein n=1 Tax=Peptoniphilus porci TaxID=2652280 RepID=A0A1U7M1Q0_9FIRM|nr:hypothetical protein [Peptoniphilus porci]OLR65574.1 hypothetical protein BIV18_08650 [Peptoniphilus porci]
MKRYFVSFLVLFALMTTLVYPVFANENILGFDDDTIYVRVVRHRYDRSFPSSIFYTEYRAGRKFRGNLNIDWNSVQRESNNMYSAVYEGILYDVGYASYVLDY